MSRKRSCLGRLLLIIIIVGLLAVGILFYFGYRDYREAVEEIPLTEKIAQIQSNPEYVTIDEISGDFQRAIVAVEDKRFYRHGALDPIGFGRAVVTNLRNQEFSEGGSTITQQVAKNLYFSNEKRLTRKIAEALVAMDLEKEYSKDEILEFYCNIIFFGQSYYGISEASYGYFGKSPGNLTFEESAMLAGIPQAPSIYNPVDHPENAKARQAVVLEILEENGITTGK